MIGVAYTTQPYEFVTKIPLIGSYYTDEKIGTLQLCKHSCLYVREAFFICLAVFILKYVLEAKKRAKAQADREEARAASESAKTEAK